MTSERLSRKYHHMTGKRNITTNWRATRRLKALVYCWLTIAVLSGCAGDMPRQAQLDLSGTHTYHCERDTDVTVTFINNAVDSYYAVALHFEGVHYVLPRSGLGSGVKYSKRGVSWWTNGEQGILEKDKKIRLADCLIASPQPADNPIGDSTAGNALDTLEQDPDVVEESESEENDVVNEQAAPSESNDTLDPPGTTAGENTEDPQPEAVEIESTLPTLPSSKQSVEPLHEQIKEADEEEQIDATPENSSESKAPEQNSSDSSDKNPNND